MTIDMKRKTREIIVERSETQYKTEECFDDACILVFVMFELSPHVSSDVFFLYSLRQTRPV